MKIAIVGKSGVGKSRLGDILLSTIFKMDSDASIEVDDADRAKKIWGSGQKQNKYKITVRQMLAQVEDEQDIVIAVNSAKFNEWFNQIYNKSPVV